MKRAGVWVIGCVTALAIIGVGGPAAAAPTRADRAHGDSTAKPTIHSVSSCYVNASSSRATLEFQGSGWPANISVQLTDALINLDLTVKTNAGGDLTLTTPAPLVVLLHPGYKTYTLTAQVSGTSYTASAKFRVTALMFSATPSYGNPDATVKWMFSGFKTGKHIYGHFRYHDHEAATANYGVAAGPCGTLTSHQRLFPGGHPTHLVYGYQVDDAKAYSTASRPRIVGVFTVS